MLGTLIQIHFTIKGGGAGGQKKATKKGHVLFECPLCLSPLVKTFEMEKGILFLKSNGKVFSRRKKEKIFDVILFEMGTVND